MRRAISGPRRSAAGTPHAFLADTSRPFASGPKTDPLSHAAAALISLSSGNSWKENYARGLSLSQGRELSFSQGCAMTLIKRFRGDLVVRTRRRGGRIEVRLICQGDGHRYWLSVTEAEYREGMTCRFVAGAENASDDGPTSR